MMFVCLMQAVVSVQFFFNDTTQILAKSQTQPFLATQKTTHGTDLTVFS